MYVTSFFSIQYWSNRELKSTCKCLYYNYLKYWLELFCIQFLSFYQIRNDPLLRHLFYQFFCFWQECLFDYTVTGSIEFANETKRLVEEFETRIQVLNKNITICPDIQSPENGFRDLTHIMVNGSVTFRCKDGFSLSNEDVVLACNEWGSWEGGEAPSCEKDSSLYIVLISLASVGCVIIALVLLWFFRKRVFTYSAVAVKETENIAMWKGT